MIFTLTRQPFHKHIWVWFEPVPTPTLFWNFSKPIFSVLATASYFSLCKFATSTWFTFASRFNHSNSVCVPVNYEVVVNKVCWHFALIVFSDIWYLNTAVLFCSFRGVCKKERCKKINDLTTNNQNATKKQTVFFFWGWVYSYPVPTAELINTDCTVHSNQYRCSSPVTLSHYWFVPASTNIP